MNNSDQPQSAKDMYQVPTTLSETVSIDIETPEQPQVVIDRQFDDIVRDQVRLDFEEITKELALSAAGIESPYTPAEKVELAPNPHTVAILDKGGDITSRRMQRHAEEVAFAQSKRLFRKVTSTLLSHDPSADTPLSLSQQATIEYLAELEDSVAGQRAFPIDRKIEPDVKTRRFFFLPDGRDDVWFMQQISSIRSKNFTNSYKIRPHGVEKSSTYFDEFEGRDKNVAIMAAHDEIMTLKAAVAYYHREVIEKIYTKPVGSKNRIKSSGLRGRTK